MKPEKRLARKVESFLIVCVMIYVPTEGVCKLHGRVQGKELNFER